MKLDQTEYDFSVVTLKRALVKRGWTQSQLADRAGLAESTVSQVLTGKGRWYKAIHEMEIALGLKKADRNGDFKN